MTTSLVTRPRTLPRFTTRPHIWLRPDLPLVCPNHPLTGQLLKAEDIDDPHRLRTNAALLQHEVFTCQFRHRADAPECGAIVFAIAWPGGWRYVATVTVPELRHMRASHMSADDALAYVGSARAA